MLKQVTNEYEVTYHEVLDSKGELKGRVYRTWHPTIPFEAFTIPPARVQSKRTMTLQEGEDFVLCLAPALCTL